MPNRRRLLSLALLVLGSTIPVALPAAAGSPTPAATDEVAAEELRIQDPVVLYAGDTAASPRTVPIQVDLVNESPPVRSIYFDVHAEGPIHEFSVRSGFLELESGTGTDGTWIGDIKFDNSDYTGRHLIVTDLFNPAPGVDGGPDRRFYVKRNTIMPVFNAYPEHVRQGSAIRVHGRLVKLWPDFGYVGYRGKTIDVYFKPIGGDWTLQGSATTDRNGDWSRNFTASADGTWQARFKGTSNYHRERSRYDYVDVR